ncbi:hypothetical protein [Rhizobium sp. Leaf341]|uniref:hypothetical protein n=1 Tax=Rhizobium sp. Leaf341 TaxID=1736344 RepID=UPI00071450E3|nr:hypothetical protein [Rhizobium sp. Leaf341]KQR77570.1 hypothetical protein ASG03_14265 [Rhizobium sp. Leaf341]
MGQITDLAKTVYALGPSTAPSQPDKSQIVSLFQLLETILGTAISGLVIGNSVVYATRAALYAAAARPAGSLAIVYNDSNQAYNGVYVTNGGTGSAAWSLTSLIPPSSFVADLSNVVSGLAAEVAARTTTTDEVVAARSGQPSLTARFTTEVAARTAGDAKVKASFGRALSGTRSRGGKTPMSKGNAGAVTWFDALLQRVRSYGDPLTGHAVRRAGWIVPMVNRMGAIIGGMARDGEWYSPGAVSAPMAYPVVVTDGNRAQAHVADGAVERRLSLYESPVRASKVAAPGLVRSACADGSIRHSSYRGQGVDLAPDNALRLIIKMGQSLGYGGVNNDPAAYITQAPSPRVLMWQQGVVPAGASQAAIAASALTTMVPAFEQVISANFGETGDVALAWMLNGPAGRRGGSTYQVANFCKGNTPYSGIKKGTVPYANAIAHLQAVKAWCTANGYTPVIEALIFDHGENDSAADVSEATFQGYQVELLTDFSADAAAIFGVTQFWPMFVVQKGIFRSGLLSGPSLAQANCNAANSRMFCVGPQYMIDFQDFYHPPSWMHRVRTAYIGKAIRSRLMTNEDTWSLLKAVSGTIVGQGFELVFNVPRGPIQLDTSIVSDPGTMGITYTDDSTTPAVILPGSLRVSGPDRIVGSFDKMPTGGNRKIRIGWAAGTNAAQGRINGPRTCIHDSDMEACPATGWLLLNYAIHQEISL